MRCAMQRIAPVWIFGSGETAHERRNTPEEFRKIRMPVLLRPAFLLCFSWFGKFMPAISAMSQSCLLAAPGAAGRAIPVWRRRLARRRIKLQFVNDVQRFVAFFCHTIQIF